MRKESYLKEILNSNSLQWGRNLIVAEGRGQAAPQKGLEASMGPQLDSCGRTQILGSTSSGFDWLQWGRNLIVAEGATTALRRNSTRTLQWGRNLIVAEGSRGSETTGCQGRASMGPQLDSCGREYRRPVSMAGNVLQWGRNLIVAEGHHRYYVPVGTCGASMGPQLDSCGRKERARRP